MSNENKQEQKVEEQQEMAPVKGPRGEIGKATASLTLRQLWHAAYFRKVSIKDDKGTHIRFDLVPNPGGPSLKTFARSLVKDGNQIAKDWFAHKHGSLDQKRSEKNAMDAKAAASATKQERRKKKAS